MALELSSSIPTWINGVPCIPVENVNITKGRPTKRRKGGFGYIGKQRGQVDPQIKVTLPLQATPDQFFDPVHDILDDDAPDFRFEWVKDGRRYAATGCSISQDDDDTNNDGDGNRNITIIPGVVRKIS
jgi:hypothetical protein